jgi:hypothetical protein
VPPGDYLLEELYSFVEEGWEQEDDITLLTLKRSATRDGTSENPLPRTRINRTVGALLRECVWGSIADQGALLQA